MKTKEVIDYLNSKFHPEYQEDYDNAGFLLGDARSEYKGALVALDLTPSVVDEAVKLGMSLIVTHHPFIFRGVKQLTDATETGRMTMTLIKNDISVYAAHTNLDNLPWGVNGALAEKLGLTDTRVLHANANSEQIGAGMLGELSKPESAEDFLQKVKALLGIPFIRISPLSPHPAPKTVKRVAICGGSGSEFIGDALAAGADIYITADLKYHDFQRTDDRMVLADAGHFETEQFAREIIFRAISEKFSNFACRISASQQGIVGYI